MTKLNQGERLVKIETHLEELKEKFDNHIEREDKRWDDLITKLDQQDNKFAGKWVEKVQVGVLITVLAGVMLGAIALL